MTREPELKHYGAAWRITARANVDQDATVESWLVQGPWHPLWTYWLVASVHLRDMPGQSRPPVKRFAAATHEFLILSLQSPPGIADVHPDPDDLNTLRHLDPPDVVTQFVATDEEARKLVDLAVKAIVLTGKSPDSDYREWWVRSIPRTLEHIRFGKHPE